MKVELTRGWTHSIRCSSVAEWKGIHLLCYDRGGAWGNHGWAALVSLGIVNREGPRRESPAEAQRDAERLAVELLLDIRDGARAIMEEYGVSKR